MKLKIKVPKSFQSNLEHFLKTKIRNTLLDGSQYMEEEGDYIRLCYLELEERLYFLEKVLEIFLLFIEGHPKTQLKGIWKI